MKHQPGSGFNLSTVFSEIASALPNNEAFVWRSKRLTYSDLDSRASALAKFLVSKGLGCFMERDALEGHESGQDHLGLYLLNGNEYLEGLIGSARARVAAFNVNYRYVEEELFYLLNDAGAKALIFHARYANEVQKLRARLPQLQVLIQVADDSNTPLLEGAYDYESLISFDYDQVVLPTVSGDDLFIMYTGGTTGMPKGVLWRQDDVYITGMGGTPYGSNKPHSSYEDAVAAAVAASANGQSTMVMVPPLMHGAATWSAFWSFSSGGRIVLPNNVEKMDAADILSAVERERAISFSTIGDAVARPLIEEIETGKYDLSGLFLIANGGAPLSPALKDRIIKALPHVYITDGAGSSEAGVQMSQMTNKDVAAETAVFTPTADNTVLDDTMQRELRPGEGGGWLARRGRIPLGYLGDKTKSQVAFPVINGQRWAIPGDRANLREDGSVELLGRDSVTINSGGEKIFAEEVERAISGHPCLKDVMVVGRPSERWGSEVVALVVLDESSEPVSDQDILAEAGKYIARYKLPKQIIRMAQLVRSPSGKPDYRWAKQVALSEA